MKRITSLMLSAALLLAAMMSTGFAAPANASTLNPNSSNVSSFLGHLHGANSPKAAGPWLPDPCNLFGVDGSYAESHNIGGVNYDYYIYMVNCTFDEICESAVDYNFCLMDLGYYVMDLDLEDYVIAANYSKENACAEMAITVYDDGGYYNPDGIITWLVILAVSEDMHFQQGQETPGVVNGHRWCPGCEGSGKCQGCYGSGRCNYGAGYETCVVCDGARYCNICDGVGY